MLSLWFMVLAGYALNSMQMAICDQSVTYTIDYSLICIGNVISVKTVALRHPPARVV